MRDEKYKKFVACAIVRAPIRTKRSTGDSQTRIATTHSSTQTGCRCCSYNCALDENLLMKIENFIWLRDIIDKLTFKHQVDTSEVEEVFDNRPKIRFVQKGDCKGEDVYIALGRSEAGRYLAIIFVHKKNNDALIVSARDMAKKERKQYERK